MAIARIVLIIVMAFLSKAGDGYGVARATEVQGAGSTFAAPLYQGLIERFRRLNPNVAIHYAPVGSGEGVARFMSGTVDFAGSDVAISETGGERHESVGAQLPIAAGMIVLAYNLPGVVDLKLPREVYSDIFLRKIRKWDDPKILAANPHLTLPSIPIEVVAREDSSGTTFAFSSHMNSISSVWAPGVGKLIQWPSNVILAKGNEGVAQRIKSDPGAIGYVEFGVAKRSMLAMAQLENRNGKFITPSLEACRLAVFTNAYLTFDWLKNMILDPTDVGAYPIVTYSWMILHWEYPDEKWKTIVSFVDFILGDGQNLAGELGYASLPSPIVYRGKMVLGRIMSIDGKLLGHPNKPLPDPQQVLPRTVTVKPSGGQRAPNK